MHRLAPTLLLALALALPSGARAKRHAHTATASPEAPAGFTAMEVITVLPAGEGGTVMLSDAEKARLVPIAVGGTEALTIALRAERRRYERPLTHDLLDTMVRELGGEVTEVRIDALRSNVFVATLTLQQGQRATQIDLRASDAIAVALGRSLPIWMADGVLAETGLPWGEMVPPDILEPAPDAGQPQL